MDACRMSRTMRLPVRHRMAKQHDRIILQGRIEPQQVIVVFVGRQNRVSRVSGGKCGVKIDRRIRQQLAQIRRDEGTFWPAAHALLKAVSRQRRLSAGPVYTPVDEPMTLTDVRDAGKPAQDETEQRTSAERDASNSDMPWMVIARARSASTG